MKRAQSAFTLIEVIVAVAVLAVAMGAIISGMARYADNAAWLREKTLAVFVAHNRLTEIELEGGWPELGKSDGDAEMAGIDWRWYVEVIETPDPDVRRIDIRVRAEGHEADAASFSAFKSSAAP